MIQRAPIVIVPPETTPVSLDDIKQDLRVEGDDSDPKIERNLVEATQWLERRLSRALMTQTLEITLDTFPPDFIALPYGPVASIVSVEYDNATGTTVLDGSAYVLDGYNRLYPADTWPSDAVGVRVRFVAGVDDPFEIPEPIKAALRFKVQELLDGIDNARFINRELAQFWNPVA
jgi:uncharacterized phiE125 gp8 family phage protein